MMKKNRKIKGQGSPLNIKLSPLNFEILNMLPGDMWTLSTEGFKINTDRA